MPSARIPTLPEHRSPRTARRARNLRRMGLIALTAVLVAGLVSVLGVRSGTARASSSGYDLAVTYPVVIRAGLATPFRVRVTHAGGFDAPVRLAISAAMFERFDFQDLSPDPAMETADGTHVHVDFDPPPGDVLEVALDAKTGPDQNGSFDRYHVALLVNDQTITEVRFRMVVLP